MSGGRVELGLGTGWYEGEHTAYGIPFPPLGERFERLEEQLAILTGTMGDAGRRELLLRRDALPAGGQPGPAQAAPATPSAADPGRRRRQTHAPPRGHLRRRVQRALSRGGRHAGPVRPGARRLRAPSTATPPASRSRRPRSSVAAPTRPKWPAGPGPSAGRSTSCAPTGRRARPTRWSNADCASSGRSGPGTVYLQVLDLDDLDHLRLLSERRPTATSSEGGRCPAQRVALRARGSGRGPWHGGVAGDAGRDGSVIRATVSPPTATQLCVVGQDRPVRASGVYSVADAVKSAPPSLLWATAPVPTAGVPTQFVPTMAQIEADGQAMP